MWESLVFRRDWIGVPCLLSPWVRVGPILASLPSDFVVLFFSSIDKIAFHVLTDLVTCSSVVFSVYSVWFGLESSLSFYSGSVGLRPPSLFGQVRGSMFFPAPTVSSWVSPQIKSKMVCLPGLVKQFYDASKSGVAKRVADFPSSMWMNKMWPNSFDRSFSGQYVQSKSEKWVASEAKSAFFLPFPLPVPKGIGVATQGQILKLLS